jgi:hypothetical protein
MRGLELDGELVERREIGLVTRAGQVPGERREIELAARVGERREADTDGLVFSLVARVGVGWPQEAGVARLVALEVREAAREVVVDDAARGGQVPGERREADTDGLVASLVSLEGVGWPQEAGVARLVALEVREAAREVVVVLRDDAARAGRVTGRREAGVVLELTAPVLAFCIRWTKAS